MAPKLTTPSSLAEQQALSWVARLSGTPPSLETQADFAVWLRLDPAHAKHFDSAVALWELAGQIDEQRLTQLGAPPAEDDVLADQPAVQLMHSVTIDQPPTSHAALPMVAGTTEKTRWFGVQARLGAWLLVFFASALWLSPEAPVRHVTGTGEYERLPLHDGSVLHLNTNTRVNLHFSDAYRDLQLIRGELFIEVAHDPKRPLRVHTQSFSATAIGTAFSVATTEKQQWVHVANGTVAVSERPQAGNLIPAAPATSLTKGQLLTSGAAGLDEPEYSPQSVATWRHGQLLYRNVKLADLVVDLNRYHAQQLVIHDPELQEQQVTAVLNATSFAEASQALVSSLGLESLELSPGVVLLQYRRR